MTDFNRRQFLTATAVATTAMATRGIQPLWSAIPMPQSQSPSRLRLSLKIGMVGGKASLTEKFALVKRLGYDGIELNSPSDLPRDEVLAAKKETGLPIHGVVNSTHWSVRLSDANESVREAAIKNLRHAILDAKAYGGSSVLLVPGRVSDAKTENQQQVWDRSILGIRQVLPLAAGLGIHILIENVWNGFCYTHDGPDNQSADKLADYLDAINSPWVGAYFDIGNHRKYGAPEEWIRTLGRRIVKLDVKDWGKKAGWAKIGDGDVNWTEVRKALREIGYTGWCTAEVQGGNEDRLADVKARMERTLRTHP